jgi:hypothetical protein
MCCTNKPNVIGNLKIQEAKFSMKVDFYHWSSSTKKQNATVTTKPFIKLRWARVEAQHEPPRKKRKKEKIN